MRHVLLLAFLLPMTAAALGVANGDFRRWASASSPSDWRCPVDGVTATVTRAPDRAAEPDSAALEVRSTRATDWSYCTTSDVQDLRALPNARVVIEFWSRKTAEGSVSGRSKYVEVRAWTGAEWTWVGAQDVTNDPANRWVHHSAALELPPTTQKVSVGMVVYKDGGFRLDDVRLRYEPRLLGVNYYPALSPWSSYWTNWTATKPHVAVEFSAARRMGINSIRTFASHAAFGGRDCAADPEFAKLNELLELASKAGIGVVLTLFDGINDTVVADIEGSKAHLNCFISRYRSDPRIVMWDVINEPDGHGFVVNPVDPASGWKPGHLAWLQAMFTHLKANVTQPITIGTVTHSGWMVDLCKRSGFAGVVPQSHDYSPFTPQDRQAYINRLATNIDIVWSGCNKRPVLIGEFGSQGSADPLSPTYRAGWTEAAQADQLSAALEAFQQNLGKLYGVMPWALNDFAVPQEELRHWGLIRSIKASDDPAAPDGYSAPGSCALKPSGTVVQSYFRAFSH